MSSRLIGLPLLFAGSLALAAPGGKGGGAPRVSPPTSEEAARAATAVEWKDLIEKARANAPQHPPDPVFHFPSKNRTFLASLRVAENPRGDLERYLNKLWNEAVESPARRAALVALFDEAEKPAWARPAIEEFFRKRMNGGSLHPVEPAASPAPEAAVIKPEAKPEAAVIKPEAAAAKSR